MALGAHELYSMLYRCPDRATDKELGTTEVCNEQTMYREHGHEHERIGRLASSRCIISTDANTVR